MLRLKNEFIMASIKLGYSDGSGKVNEKHIGFYNQRSQFLGAVIPEPLYLHANLREIPTQLGIDGDDKISGLRQLTATIQQYLTKAIAHINHPGRMANPRIPGNIHWSSTDKACENGGAQPKPMDETMMDFVTELHLKAVQRAERARFDAIELQFGHGYLMAQFLSPAVNDRTDEYGGSLENRMRYPLRLAKAVVDSTNLPIMARVSGDEMIANGLQTDEVRVLCQELEKIGVWAIHVSAGSACSTPPWFFQHMFVPKGKTWSLARQIQDDLKIPVVYVGKINQPDDISKLKNKYHARFMAIGRALVADPLFIGKYLGKIHESFRPCLACAEGCLGGVRSGKGLGCVVNPLVNTGFKLPQIELPTEKYAVIGGGLAGMQAAIVLAQRGQLVYLFEKNQFGGQFNLAWLPPQKENLKYLVDYFKKEIRDYAPHLIHIIRQEATLNDLVNKGYKKIIVATGALPKIPPIQGLREYYWTEFLNASQLPVQKKVLIIGGGLIGLEMASKLVDAENQVVVVEMLDEMAQGMEMMEKSMTLKKLAAKNAELITSHQVVEIDGAKVTIQGSEGQRVLQGVDKIVLATGMQPYRPIPENEDLPIVYIGDANKVGNAQDAIHQAYELALTI
jgi:2,4-dienoyl-CoA reductase-like NADH-dependent reductase (Old Yellow Enzyme family)/thioredoxin reductase